MIADFEYEYSKLDAQAFKWVVLEIKKCCIANGYSFSKKGEIVITDKDNNIISLSDTPLKKVIDWFEKRAKKLPDLCFENGIFTPNFLNNITVHDLPKNRDRERGISIIGAGDLGIHTAMALSSMGTKRPLLIIGEEKHEFPSIDGIKDFKLKIPKIKSLTEL